MTAYTDDEITAAVEKLVLASIRRPYDTLGVRRTDISFNDVQQAAAGVFILYPNAPFYVLYLGTQRLNDLIASEQALLDELVNAIDACERVSFPVQDVSALFNAQAALQELGAAAVARGQAFRDITTVPAYQRYTANVTQFLDGPGQNIKVNGNVVMTPQQARAALPGLLAQVIQAHQLLVQRVTGIVGGLEDYEAVNLPGVVAQSVLANSAVLVGDDAAALSSLTPEERLADIRQVVLNLLATKAVVGAFGSFNAPSDYYNLKGLGRAYSDAQHLATPAVATSTISGPVGIAAGVNDVLHVVPDGGTPFDITLNPSLLAQLDGQRGDSGFIIGDGTDPPQGTGYITPDNDRISVLIGGNSFAPVLESVPLTHSSPSLGGAITGTGDTTTGTWYIPGVGVGHLDFTTLSIRVNELQTFVVSFSHPTDATDLIGQINAVTNTGGADDAVASIVADRLVLTSVKLGPLGSVRIISGSSISILGFTVGEQGFGPAAGPRTADQIAVDIGSWLGSLGFSAKGIYAPLKYSGPFDIPAGTNVTWTVTGGATDLLALGVAVGDTVCVLSGPNAGDPRVIVGVTSTTIDVVGVVVLQAAAPSEVGPLERRVRIYTNTPSIELPDERFITMVGDTTKSKNALATLGFFPGITSICTPTMPNLVADDINGKTGAIVAGSSVAGPVTSARARGDLLNPSLVVFAAGAFTGTQSFVTTTLTFTVTAVDVEGSVSVGDVLALRSGPNVGKSYSITTVNGVAPSATALNVGDVVVATGTFAGGPSVGVSMEVGPNVAATKFKVVVVEDGPNKGTYVVQSQGATPLDVLLQRALPTPFTGLLVTVMTATFGAMSLTLSSVDTTTNSSLAISGTAAPLFFGTVPFEVVGSSPWFLLPNVPRGCQAGDVLETYATRYNAPSGVFIVQQVVNNLRVLQIAPDIQSAQSWQFSVQPVPFARLRFGTKNDYTSLRLTLISWLAERANQPLFFENFNRLVNPLLVSTSPTAAQVKAAKQELEKLYQLLTAQEAVVDKANPTLALDHIITTFTVESVNAVDTLLKSFVEKGSDRANDLLLQGSFSEFFNLSADGSSYAGALQTAVRDVAMNDLPVRRYNRAETQNAQLVASTQSPDFEYSAASVNEVLPGAQVNPPTDYGEPSTYGKK